MLCNYPELPMTMNRTVVPTSFAHIRSSCLVTGAVSRGEVTITLWRVAAVTCQMHLLPNPCLICVIHPCMPACFQMLLTIFTCSYMVDAECTMSKTKKAAKHVHPRMHALSAGTEAVTKMHTTVGAYTACVLNAVNIFITEKSHTLARWELTESHRQAWVCLLNTPQLTETLSTHIQHK